MCGICGVVDLNGRVVEPRAAQRMRNALTHRGPDGEGAEFFESDSAGPSAYLGHRRLKIIDLSDEAKQPLANEDGTVFVTFNGEIYNFRELRKLLDSKEHKFRSDSDTEVIVHGYEEFGDSVVEHLHGMFAFALWDQSKRRLLMARDRSGKKPLFYHLADGRLTFGSEIKALAVCPWVERSVNEDRLGEFLYYGYVASPDTLHRGIKQVPPASYMVFDQAGLGEPVRFWRMKLATKGVRVPVDDACRQVQELTTSAVEKRLISDVPLGAFLSGGIDSSVVVGLMSKITKQPVKTFTIGFTGEPSYDERASARLVAEHFRTDHTDYAVDVDAAELVEQLLWHHDQPYGDSSAIPSFIVSQMARRDVTVALVGDGGDEVFAGYDRFLAAKLAAAIPKSAGRFLKLGASALPGSSGYFSPRRRATRFFEALDLPVEDRYRGWISIFGDERLNEILHGKVDAVSLHRAYASVLSANQDKPLLHRLMEANFEGYLPEDLMVKMDRMSMAHGLETRSPLLDTDLVEYAANLPPNLKLKGRQLKYLLKRSFASLLPQQILKLPKHGFGVPLGRWFRSSLSPMFSELVLSGSARCSTYVDHKATTAMFKSQQAGELDHSNRLWVLLNLELWMRSLERPQTESFKKTSLLEIAEA